MNVVYRPTGSSSSSSRSLSRSTDGAIDEYVCFNTILEIVCDADQVIVFDSARYGRNHSTVAAQCDVPFTRNCDIDVHFSLNRACAGKPRCSMAVNTAFFGDPCGYDEFLRVTYRCIPGERTIITLFGARLTAQYFRCFDRTIVDRQRRA
jgi:hypothetical protein